MPQLGRKYDVIAKKTKKGLHRNLKGFSGQKQVISKKKKSKTARPSPKFEEFFRRKTSDLQKKTKKQVISKKKKSSSFTC